MAISITSLTSGGSASSAASYDTASITPSSNKLVLVSVANPRAAGSPNTPTISGNGMTWTQVRTFLDASASLRRITVFRGVLASPSAGAITIDFAGQSQDSCLWSVVEFTNADISGANGANGVVQSVDGEADGTVTGLSITLSAFSDADNATYGTMRHNSDALAVSPGSGFTEVHEVAITNAGMQTEFKATNDTGVDWSWTSVSLNATGIAIEIRHEQPEDDTIGMFLA